MSMKLNLTAEQMRDVAHYLDDLTKAGKYSNVYIDSYADLSIVVGESRLTIVRREDGEYEVSDWIGH